MAGGSHRGTKWIPFPLPPHPEHWRASTRPTITIGPILADASCILAIFRLSYFISQNFHRSQPQSQRLHHRHFHHLRETEGVWGTEGAHKLGSWDTGPHGVWLFQLLVDTTSLRYSKSQSPSPAFQEERGRSHLTSAKGH